MLIIKKGDILQAPENLICHQVNEYGSMGGGLALQIAIRFPEVEREYNNYCKIHKTDFLFGKWLLVGIDNGRYICNCFTQKDFNTQYEAIKNIFSYLKELCIEANYSICIPYNYGCGISNGDWRIVESILIDIFDNYDITVYKLEEE